MGNLGLPELLVILFIVILIFGARKLPELGKNLGEGIKNFKGAMNEGMKDADRDTKVGSGDAKH